MRKSRFVGLVLPVALLLVLAGCGELDKEVEKAGYSNVTVVSEDDKVSVVTAEAGKCKVRITREKTTGFSTHKYTVEYVKSDKETVQLKKPSEALLNKEDAEAKLLNEGLCGKKK